jgi:KDO2-lipid IV(A) lauroyltransferase
MFLRLRHRIEHGFYLVGKTLFRVLPRPMRLHLGKLLGGAAFHLDRRHRKVALDNLRLAYPDSSDEERLDITHRSFQSFGELLADVLGASVLDREKTSKRFDVEGWHHLEVAEARNQGIILVTGHLGNWEAIPQYMALTGRPMSFVARPLDNPLMDKDLRRIRERFGSETILKRSAARGLLRVLRAKGRVGLLMDQRVHPNEGKAYPFFGSPAYTTTMPARISIRTGAPVIPIFSFPTDGWERTHIVVRPPIYPDDCTGDTESRIDQLTTRYLEAIEAMIREHPHLWLWMHRRWRQYPNWPYNGRGNRLNGKAQGSSPTDEALPRSSRQT